MRRLRRIYRAWRKPSGDGGMHDVFPDGDGWAWTSRGWQNVRPWWRRFD